VWSAGGARKWGSRALSTATPRGLSANAYPPRVAYRVLRPDEFEWITRPHEPGEPARHVAELSDRLGFGQVPGNVWRYEPGATGRRHFHIQQAETFVVLAGTLTMYLGDPPERVDLPIGSVIHIEPGTALQSANHGDADLLVYAYGTPPEDQHAELLDPAV
jgi:quercetin dioxygenase-like cupin family protein